jgi:hypothetical protein
MLDTLFRHLSMVRLSAGFAGLILLFGCKGLITGDGSGSGSGDTPEQRDVITKWETKAWPAFQQATCTSCHAGNQPGIGFLAGDTDLHVRDTLIMFSPQVVNIDAPPSSRVLTKGAHSGPALNASQTGDILEWIQAEADAAGGTGSGSMILETPPFDVQLCTSGVAGDPTCPINTVDLSALPNAPPLPGAKITFVAQALSSTDIYVTDLYATTGTDGLYVEHPLFVYLPPAGTNCPNGLAPPCPDTIDRFFAVKLDMMGTDPRAAVGGGIASFAGFAAVSGAQFQITFKVVDKFRADTSGGGTQTGCKVLQQFTQMVVPVMTNNNGEANNCAGCHTGQNASATSAMDITGIKTTADMTMQQTACNQVRSRIDFNNIPGSGIMLAPQTGQDAAHPFKIQNATTFNNFKTALVNWANAEKVAP